QGPPPPRGRGGRPDPQQPKNKTLTSFSGPPPPKPGQAAGGRGGSGPPPPADGGIWLLRTPYPQPVCELAGTRRVIETATKVIGGMWGDEGSSRIQHAWTADPDIARTLDVGQAGDLHAGGCTSGPIARPPPPPPPHPPTPPSSPPPPPPPPQPHPAPAAVPGPTGPDAGFGPAQEART